MVDLHIYVEGEGERGFVGNVLAPHLQTQGVYAQPMWMGRRGKPAGGIRKWEGNEGVKGDLKRALQSSSRSYGLFVTTMVDYYGLPSDWPNRDTASALPMPQRSPSVESGMLEAVRAELGDDWRIRRFIPYVCLHEFDALILSDPDALLTEFPGSRNAIAALKHDIRGIAPEDIDDDPSTAPSKRIGRFLPNYERRKGIVAANTLCDIALRHIRTACPHFGRWLCCLESLAFL